MKTDITRLPLVPVLMTGTILMALVFARYAAAPFDAELIAGGMMPVGRWMDKMLDAGSTLSIVVFLGLIFVNAVIVTRMMIGNMVSAARTYIPFLFYVIIGCGIYCHTLGSVTALAATLLLLALRNMTRGFRRLPSVGLFFHASLMLGFIPLLWAPGAAYVLMIPIAVRLFRRSFRELVASFVGFALPFAIASYIIWAGGGEFYGLAKEWWDVVGTPSGYALFHADMEAARLAIWSLLILLAFLSAGTFAAYANQMRTRQRRVYLLHINLLAVTIGMMFMPCLTPAVMPLLAVPLAVIFQPFFVRYAGAVSTILCILLMAAVAFLNIPFGI